MTDKAIFEGGVVKPAKSLQEWAHWYETADRVIASTYADEGGSRVSTVFLGINYQFDKDGPPLWFETMVFGGQHDQLQEHYATLEEAMVGHQKMVALVNDEIGYWR